MELRGRRKCQGYQYHHNPQIVGFDERIKREFDEGKELLEFC